MKTAASLSVGENERLEGLFARIAKFSWDESKRETNLQKHKIDFEDAIGVFDGPVLIKQSDRYGEVRYKALGVVEGREIAVICTLRGRQKQDCRIISARRARREERREYHRRVARRAGERQD